MPETVQRKQIQIGEKTIGNGRPCYVIAEIGINHNGDVDLAKRLISIAVAAGCDAVKFQKRTIEIVYSAEELARPRESPFGTTNGDLKHALEFDYDDFVEIDQYCRAVKIPWFASCWDEPSVDLIIASMYHVTRLPRLHSPMTTFSAIPRQPASRSCSPPA